MTEMSLTVFDMTVLFVVGVSVLLALARGLVRESLSIGVWVLSALIAFVAFPELRQLIADYVPNVWLGDAITLTVVFLAPLICLKIVAMVIADSMPTGLFGSLDRILGAGYGFLRGALVISLAYLGLNLVNAPENHPSWIKQAQLLPYVRDGAELLAGWIPEDIVQADMWQGLPNGHFGGNPASAGTLSPPPVSMDRPRDGDETGSLE